MSKKVEIYDQYSPVYSDAQNNNELTTVYVGYMETLDTNRYTLVHASSGFTSIEATDLTDAEARTVVESLYNVAKATGVSCTDKIVNLDQNYAEVVITFADGKRLNRVIHTIEQ